MGEKPFTEDELLTHCRSAIRKMDNMGPRGAEKVTWAEIEAMVVTLVSIGGPQFTAAADHTKGS